MSMLFAAMMGWCGTKWPGWRPGPKPDPDPEPWWHDLITGIIGAAGGIGAVSIIGPEYGDLGLAGTGLLGFSGGVFLGSLANSVMGMGRTSAR